MSTETRVGTCPRCQKAINQAHQYCLICERIIIDQHAALMAVLCAVIDKNERIWEQMDRQSWDDAITAIAAARGTA